ncbi:hypothetical protein TCON_2221 [Astathelohania contejeani]|uniref:Uncharacterized protein n=1 Tax=Astathelohania contejeani TaxID=164912 RepID=A0ABQ7HWL4_9MICR|nr:hypothetical protein TCON_2221 [Thelohania contejeani]
MGISIIVLNEFTAISKIETFFGETMLYNASIVAKLKSGSTIWQQAVIECLAITIRKGIMRYLGVFTFYLRISTALKNQKNYEHIQSRKSWKTKEPKFGSMIRIKTDILIKNNRPDIFMNDKKENEITSVEVGITSQDNLQIVKTEKKRKYDFLANKLGLLCKAKTNIIPYVMTWDGVVWYGNQVLQKFF